MFATSSASLSLFEAGSGLPPMLLFSDRVNEWLETAGGYCDASIGLA